MLMLKLKTLVVLVAALFMLTGCSSKQDKSAESEGTPSAVQSAARQEQAPAKLTAPITVIDFSATWCGPCQMIAPDVHELADKSTDVAQFRFVDVDENPAMADKYGVQAVPTFVILNSDGIEVDRVVGADIESLRAIINKVEK